MALTATACPASSQAQGYAPELEVLAPGRDGVLWLDRGDISHVYLDRLQRRQRVRPMRPEHRVLERAKPRRFAQTMPPPRRFAQDVLRPPEEIRRTETPRNDPPPPARDELRDRLREEMQRLSSDIARMRSETDTLREIVGRLSGETTGLRGEIGALREELAKRVNEPVVTGKLSEPMRKENSLKGGANEKSTERPPANVEGIRRPDERFSDLVARAWRRVKEMMGRPSN